MGRLTRRTAFRTAPRILAALLATTLAGPASAQQPPATTATPQSAATPATQLATLVNLLSLEDPLLRWDLSGIALNAMVASNQASLDRAVDDLPDTAADRRKLWRWQQATAALIQRLGAGRDALEAGAPFELMVDAQGQVLIVIDGDVIIVSGWDRDSDRRLRQRIVERFCRFNDCGWLGLQAPHTEPPTRTEGMRESTPP